MTMATKTTPTDIRYEHMHIDMMNGFVEIMLLIDSVKAF